MNERHLAKLRDIVNPKIKNYNILGIKVRTETIDYSIELINFCSTRNWDKINIFSGIRGELEILVYFENTYFEVIFNEKNFEFAFSTHINKGSIIRKSFMDFDKLLIELENIDDKGNYL